MPRKTYRAAENASEQILHLVLLVALSRGTFLFGPSEKVQVPNGSTLQQATIDSAGFSGSSWLKGS